MAETGSKSPLDLEVDAAISAGQAAAVLSGAGIGGPGETTLTFAMTQAHPLVTLVCMVAPSPDWFVGVHGLPLFENGCWASTRTVALPAYDAGTDSGASYTSPNAATIPPETIRRIPLEGESRPLGTFTFTRIE